MASATISPSSSGAAVSSANAPILTRFGEAINVNGCNKQARLSPKGVASITIIPFCNADGSEPIPFTISCQDLSGGIDITPTATLTDIPSQCVGAKDQVMEDYTVKLTIPLRYNKWINNARILAATYGSSLGANKTVGGVNYEARGVSLLDLNKAPNYFYIEIQPVEASGLAYTRVFPCCMIAQAVQGSLKFGKTDERVISVEATAVITPEEFRAAGNPLSTAIDYTWLPIA